jgi:large subunit ribosomal protein L23
MNRAVLVPKISEKAIYLADRGQYVFEVPTRVNKIEVAQAVEAAFKVKVTGVNILVAKGKVKSFRRQTGKRTDIKKAIVTLKSGDSIKLFEGAK